MDYTILAASLLALVLYINTLPADFAYDDSRAILKNPDLLPETPLINLVYDDFWGTPLTHSGSHKSYRPLCVLTFRLNYYLGQLNPWGYHLGNVLLHALVTGVFTYLAKKFLKRRIPSLVAGCLFASHPVHTEAVAGIVGRADEGACLFFILTLLNYMKYVEYRDSTEEGSTKKRWRYIVGVYVFTTAGLLTKEQAITVLAVCLSYDMFIVHRVKITDIISLKILKLSRLLEGGVLLTVYGVVLVLLRIYFMGNKPPEFAPSDNPASDSDSFIARLLTYHLLPSYNVWLLLCPRVLSFDWSMEAIPLVQSVTDPRNVWTILLYSFISYSAYKLVSDLNESHAHAFRCFPSKPHTNGNGVHGHHSASNATKTSFHNNNKSRLKRRGSNSSTDSCDDTPPVVAQSQLHLNLLIISLSIIIFPFIPASNMFFYVGFVIAERILYIPSMGFCLLVAHGAYILHKKCSKNWQKTAVVVSLAFTVILFSCKTFLRNQDWQTEERLYKSGITVNPPKAWGNLANIWNGQKKLEEAEQAYRSALKYRGNMADVHYNLGILLQEQRRFEEALECYNKARHYRPKLSMAYLNQGIILAQLGSSKEAEKMYKTCADLDTSGLKDPRLHEGTKISCLYNLGRLYTEDDKLKEAIDVFHEGLRRRPSHYAPQSLYNMLGEAYVKKNNYDEGAKWFKEALKAKPDHIPAHLTMGKLLQKKNQIAEAEQWFKKALKIDENDVSVLHHYAQFLAETDRINESAAMYRIAVEKSDDDFELMFNAANVFRQINNFEAEEAYRKAVKIKPHVATAHMNLGAMLHTNEKYKEAEKSYLEALRLKPDDSITKTNLQKLRNLMTHK